MERKENSDFGGGIQRKDIRNFDGCMVRRKSRKLCSVIEKRDGRVFAADEERKERTREVLDFGGGRKGKKEKFLASECGGKKV